ncbi:AraC family transcriptional regulator N-terminal domain-containing protein, partial [Rhizobium ruizarguesonis]
MSRQAAHLFEHCLHGEILMVKGEIPENKLGAVYETMVNLILDGSKTLTIAGRDYYYDPASYFVISIDVPATGMVQQAGPD